MPVSYMSGIWIKEEDGAFKIKRTDHFQVTEALGDCHAFVALDDGSFGTPMGRLNTEVVWSREVANQETEIETTWTIRYQV